MRNMWLCAYVLMCLYMRGINNTFEESIIYFGLVILFDRTGVFRLLFYKMF